MTDITDNYIRCSICKKSYVYENLPDEPPFWKQICKCKNQIEGVYIPFDPCYEGEENQ
jgi:hypothetical protein